jgi:hypothetical protein
MIIPGVPVDVMNDAMCSDVIFVAFFLLDSS